MDNSIDNEEGDVLLPSLNTEVLVPHANIACFFFIFMASLFILIKLFTHSLLKSPLAFYLANQPVTPEKINDKFQRWNDDWKRVTNQIRIALDNHRYVAARSP